MDKLIYIGKSNKKFTEGKTYNYMGNFESQTHMTIRANKQLVILRYEHLEYFEKNFKFLNEIEYQNLIRKNKLKNILKC